ALEVLAVGGRIADMGVGQGDDLPAVGRIRQDLLVAGHGGVEHHLAERPSGSADGDAVEDRAILQCQHGWFHYGWPLPWSAARPLPAPLLRCISTGRICTKREVAGQAPPALG